MLCAFALVFALHAPVPYTPVVKPAVPVLKDGNYVLLWNGTPYQLTLDSGTYSAVTGTSVWLGTFAWCPKERLWQVEEVHQGSGTKMRWYVTLDATLSGRLQGDSTSVISVVDPKSVDASGRKPPVKKTTGRDLPLPRPFPR